MRQIATALVFGLAVSSLSCAHRGPRGDVDIARWNSRHPQAAKDLCGWVAAFRDASHQFFEWDAAHWDRSHEFVVWAVNHPGENIEAFIAQHPSWPDFDFIAGTHRPAAEAFIAWCRRHPEASLELMNHENGLHWAGNHLGC